MAQIADIVREGPFDAFASPMDTEDSPLVTTGLPGCPYRITSYDGPAISDMNPAFGLQLHHPRFLEFTGAPWSARLLYHSPTFWVDRLGEAQAMWQQSTCKETFAVCYVAAYNVVGDDVHRHGTSGVPCRRDRSLVYSSRGTAGRQVHGSDGSVGPTDGSG